MTGDLINFRKNGGDDRRSQELQFSFMRKKTTSYKGGALSRQVGKTNEKSKVVTGNEPSLDKPTTTTSVLGEETNGGTLPAPSKQVQITPETL